MKPFTSDHNVSANRFVAWLMYLSYQVVCLFGFFVFTGLMVSACGYSTMETTAMKTKIDQQNTFDSFRKQGNGFTPEGFVQSPNDSSQYRRVLLANGSEIVLISGDFPRAAVTVDVLVGSADNPQAFLGLAHFLEHMLFLGTEKYPDPESYQQFITENNGTYNATTGTDHTNYYFAIRNELLSETMDRLAQFFIAPLFTREYTDKELEIIEAEYRRSLDNENRAIYSATKKLYNQQHPATRFTSGNKDTLLHNGRDALHQALLDFYAYHYRANAMKLVVVGNYSLDELEAMVREHFSAVAVLDAVPPVKKPPLFDTNRLPLLLDMPSKSGARSLVYRFPMPDQSRHYASKPASFVGHMIGHESPGSLLAFLRERNWATGLSAGSRRLSQSYEFVVNIDLTEQGGQNIDAIHTALFAWIALIRQQGVQQWRYQELQKMAEINFRWREDRNPLSLSRTMARLLHYYPASELYVALDVYSGYSQQAIAEIMEGLRPQSVAIRLVRPDFDIDVEGVQYDNYYHIPYTLTKLSPDFATEKPHDQFAHVFHLPSANTYIPQHNLVVDKVTTNAPQQLPAKQTYAWLYQDANFAVPRAEIWLSIASTQFRDQPKARLLLDVYLNWLNQQFAEEYYQASLAGLRYNIYSHLRGVTMKVSGYDYAVDTLFVQLAQKLATWDIPQQAFTQHVNDMRIAIEGEQTQPPYSRVEQRLFANLLANQADYEQRLFAIRSLTYQDWLVLRQQLLQAPSERTVLMHGEITQAKADKVTMHLENMFQVPQTRVDFPPIKRIVGPTFIAEPTVPKQSNQVLLLTHANFAPTFEQQVLARLATNYLRGPFFRYIRTENGLGYQASVNSFTLDDHPFVMWSTVSNNTSVQNLAEYFHNFLNDPTNHTVDIATFLQLQQGLYADYSEPLQRLNQETSRIWNELAKRNITFDSRKRLLQAVADTDVASFTQFLRKLLLEEIGSNRIWAYSGDELTRTTDNPDHTIDNQSAG